MDTVIGIIDLKTVHKEPTSLNNLHLRLFKENIETYSHVYENEQFKVVEAIKRIAMNGNANIKNFIKDPIDTLNDTKRILDKSLALDIFEGEEFPEYHIRKFRIPSNYFDFWTKN